MNLVFLNRQQVPQSALSKVGAEEILQNPDSILHLLQVCSLAVLEEDWDLMLAPKTLRETLCETLLLLPV